MISIGINIQPDKFKLFYITLFLNVMIFFQGVPSVLAQCPEIEKSDYEINIDRVGDLYSISVDILDPAINISEYQVQFYNFDRAAYHIDQTGREQVLNRTGINFNITARGLRLSNVPAGDYGIILIKQGCENKVIGYGYSGFPHSAIQVGS